MQRAAQRRGIGTRRSLFGPVRGGAQGDEAETPGGALQAMQQGLALRVVLRRLDGGPAVGQAVDEARLHAKEGLLGAGGHGVNRCGAHVHVPSR